MSLPRRNPRRPGTTAWCGETAGGHIKERRVRGHIHPSALARISQDRASQYTSTESEPERRAELIFPSAREPNTYERVRPGQIEDVGYLHADMCISYRYCNHDAECMIGGPAASTDVRVSSRVDSESSSASALIRCEPS